MKYALIVFALFLSGCAATVQPEPTSLETRGAESIWRGEYAFRMPQPPWQLYDANEEDITIVFSKIGGRFPGATAISYAEEPFGYSRNLKQRAKEFLKRYLWAARVQFDPPTFTETRWNGKAALVMDVVGHERVKQQKSRGRVLFAYRDKRVVAFILTEWTVEGESFDRSTDQALEDLYRSFRYLKPSFYQQMGF